MKKILVVDDEPLNINILVELLKDKYKMMAAKNGKQAIKAARSSNKPDLILLDIMMPEMDGLTFVTNLREAEDTKTLPVLMVTTRSVKEDIVEAMKAGVNNYIVKPFTPDTLKAKIEQVLNG